MPRHEELTNEQRDAMVRAVSQALGADWKVEADPRYPNPCGFLGLVIRHKEGYGVRFSQRYGQGAKGELHISGDFPQAFSKPYNASWPSVNCSPDKTPTQIASDIIRRLLPNYLPMWREGMQGIAAEKAREAKIEAMMTSLRGILPPHSVRFHGDTIDLRDGLDRIGWGHIMSESSDSVRLDLRSVPFAVAMEIVSVLASHLNRAVREEQAI